MQRCKLTVKKRIKWMMNMRIMTAVLVMKSKGPVAGVMMLLMQMLMRPVIISLKLAAEVKSIPQMQNICDNNMQRKSRLRANVYSWVCFYIFHCWCYYSMIP